MKTWCAWALLLLVPFASVRIVCLDAGGPPRAVLAATHRSDQRAACHGQCARRARPAAKTTCVLVADPGCQFVLEGAVAILPPAAPPHPLVRLAAAIAPLPAAGAYPAPVLTPPGPPPKV